jgi:hypothetical protein
VGIQRLTYDVQEAAAAIRATELPRESAADIESDGRPPGYGFFGGSVLKPVFWVILLAIASGDVFARS